MSVRNILHSTLDTLRDRFAPLSHTSTFLETGQITAEEFLAAGDYLVYKFPTWSWCDASAPARRVAYLPPGKQFLVTRGVPCTRRLGEGFAGEGGEVDLLIRDELSKGTDTAGSDDDGWLSTGGAGEPGRKLANVTDVRTLGESGEVSPREEEEEEIPDMEDEEDDEEAIIKESSTQGQGSMRSYTLYITYTPYYRTPRLYLSGSYPPSSKIHPNQPIPPQLMMEDIVGDYADKTVTLEDFPFYDNCVKMASIHPCRHASVMKVLLDRADAAVKIRRERLLQQGSTQDHTKVESGMAGLVDQMDRADIVEKKGREDDGNRAAGGGEEWEMLQQGGPDAEESAIRVDQYLVVFLKFMASVTPGMNYDFTMGL